MSICDNFCRFTIRVIAISHLPHRSRHLFHIAPSIKRFGFSFIIFGGGYTSVTIIVCNVSIRAIYLPIDAPPIIIMYCSVLRQPSLSCNYKFYPPLFIILGALCYIALSFSNGFHRGFQATFIIIDCLIRA